MNYKVIQEISFPQARMININMMPFRSDDPKSIPMMYRQYWDLISKCNRPNPISYLTIREGYVVGGVTQSRPGPHTEGFNNTRWGGSSGGWGKEQGLYMANNQANTCVIWDMKIDNPGNLGDCSGMKLENPYYMKSNELVWLHDRTPHQNLPLKYPALRQFFRLVVGEIDVWYSQHNTANPLGVPPMAEIIRGNKFTGV